MDNVINLSDRKKVDNEKNFFEELKSIISTYENDKISSFVFITLSAKGAQAYSASDKYIDIMNLLGAIEIAKIGILNKIENDSTI
jgi:hypothetical protein